MRVAACGMKRHGKHALRLLKLPAFAGFLIGLTLYFGMEAALRLTGSAFVMGTPSLRLLGCLFLVLGTAEIFFRSHSLPLGQDLWPWLTFSLGVSLIIPI